MSYSKLWKKVTGQSFASHCRSLIKAGCFALENEMVNPNKKARETKITPEIREYLEIEGITEEQFLTDLKTIPTTQERVLKVHRFKKQAKKADPRYNGGEDYCVCDDFAPGSAERIAQLADYYATNKNEISPFVLSPTEEVDLICQNSELLLRIVQG
jgi:hypothetical protein